MIIAGIDYSMNSPSIAVWDSSTEFKFSNCLFFNFGSWSRIKQYEGDHDNIIITKQPSYTCNEERFKNLTEWASSVMRLNNVKEAVLEGYSYGSKGVVFEIGEMTGGLKQELFRLKIPFIVTEPSHWKKTHIKNGAAKKDLIYKTLVEQEKSDPKDIIGFTREVVGNKIDTPWEIKPIDDICDSFFILKSHPEVQRAYGNS